MKQLGLILEGGGMRGVYTAGVTDFFLDQKIEFSDVYGVSAGSCVACSFLSKQRERAYHCWADYAGDDRYCSFKNLLKNGEIFDAAFAYHKIPDELNPYDYETFSKYQGNFYATVTNIITGEPEYLKVTDMHKDIRKVRASSSLPLMAKNIWIDKVPYLDGGVSDSIPIKRAISDGVKRNVIILTREDGYVKGPASMMTAMRIRYRHYPNLWKAMEKRHEVYNETLAYIKKLEESGEVFVIRPSSKVTISRLESDRTKLRQLYEQGYEDAKNCYESLCAWLNKA